MESISKADIKLGLIKLSVQQGEVIGVHSSLRSFGYVVGGADTVIDALLEVVGETGTVMMPTHSTNRTEVPIPSELTAIGVRARICHCQQAFAIER